MPAADEQVAIWAMPVPVPGASSWEDRARPAAAQNAARERVLLRAHPQGRRVGAEEDRQRYALQACGFAFSLARRGAARAVGRRRGAVDTVGAATSLSAGLRNGALWLGTIGRRLDHREAAKVRWRQRLLISAGANRWQGRGADHPSLAPP